eukprot:scaffold695_cov196-Alexandrium_tamarense.AAC.10
METSWDSSTVKAWAPRLVSIVQKRIERTGVSSGKLERHPNERCLPQLGSSSGSTQEKYHVAKRVTVRSYRAETWRLRCAYYIDKEKTQIVDSRGDFITSPLQSSQRNVVVYNYCTHQRRTQGRGLQEKR